MTTPVSTLMIRDRTAECSDGHVTWTKQSRLEFLFIHRIDLLGLGIPNGHLDGPTMCAAFQDPAKVGGYTGNENPYALLVRTPEGMIEQLTPLREQGAHAAAWNPRSVAMAIVGDFRRHHPDPRQWNRALLLAAVVSQALELKIVGHDEMRGASRDPNKICPGKYWSMPAFRAQVAELIANNRGDLGTPAAANSLLARAGAVYGG